jgi:hypothetical protein
VRRQAKALAAGSSSVVGAIRRSRLALAAATAFALTAALVLGVALASATAPAVSVDNASEVSYTTAKAKGSVNPEDHETTYRFEYAGQAQFEASEWAEAGASAEESLPAGAGPTEVGAELNGLTPSTVYHLRLVASNEDGPSEAVAASTFETDAVAVPAVTIGSPTEVTASSARFSGSVDPQGSDEAFNATWHFEYSTDDVNWTPLGDEGPLTGSGAQSVEQVGSGLEPNRHYFVRLVASNAGGQGVSATPDPEFTTEGSPPSVGRQSVADVTQTKATVKAAVNPQNEPTTFHIEYGPADCASNPCASTSESAPIGSDFTDHPVSQQITGLMPDTTYHYRVVASNGTGSTSGPDRVLTTFAPLNQPPAGAFPGQGFLPDNRAWEMVSPPDKNGGEVAGGPTYIRAAADGSAVSFPSVTGFGDVAGAGLVFQYMAERTGAPGTNGWSTHSIEPRQEPVGANIATASQQPLYLGEFSEDLSKGIFRALSPLTDAPNVDSTHNLYLRGDLRKPGPGTYQLLTDSSAPVPPARTSPNVPGYRPTFADASDDFNHILFESVLNLTDDAPAQPVGCLTNITQCLPRLYEWDHGTRRLAGILPDGSPASSSAAGRGSTASAYTDDTLSADGSRFFFTAPVDAQGRAIEGSQIYLRVLGSPTVRISASERTDCADTPDCGGDNEPDLSPDPNGAGIPMFWGSSADGSKAFFSSSEQLTDTPGSGLYAYEAGSNSLTLIVGGEEPAVIGVSDDGSYVYFVRNATQIGVWHEGTVRMIGTIDGENAMGSTGRGPFNLGAKTARVTPDGTHLAFLSEIDPGGVDSDHGDQCAAGLSLGCSEVYVYDAVANNGEGRLTCASCSSTGAAATVDASNQVGVGEPQPTISHLNHFLSDDGRHVFFTTAERLVPADTNGRRDVYEYDTLTGKQHLLSSGEGGDSYFMEASSDGHDVFFVTRQQLSGWDFDTSYDLYDARVDGGLPEPVPAPPRCQGDACQPAPTQLNDPTPASSGFSGLGNSNHRRSKSRRCPSGKHRVRTRSKVRCTKKNRHHNNRRAK